MKNISTLLCLLLFVSLTNAQERKYSTFYEQRASLFIGEDDIVFVGNSITNGGEWHELLDNRHIRNRGISGDVSQGVLDRLDPITKGCPSKIFILIGINDIAQDIPLDSINMNIRKIIRKIKRDSPQTKIYLQSVLPVNPDFGMFVGHMKPDSILALNEKIESLTIDLNVTYIDLYAHFADEENKLNKNFTNDGLHLLGEGYVFWSKIIELYVEDTK